jgi:hypothetical protein
MAKKRNIIHKNKNNIFGLFVLLVAFLLLALIIPAIGVSASSPLLWVNIVTFFESVKIHFSSYWMFYSFIAVVLFAYLGKK